MARRPHKTKPDGIRQIPSLPTIAANARRFSAAVQAAALCYRPAPAGIEFLLIRTSSGRWTFPKGWVDPGSSPREIAALEAWEEAGCTGRVDESYFDCYRHWKSGTAGGPAEVLVLAFLLCVRSVSVSGGRRRPTWFRPEDAKRGLELGRTPDYAGELRQIIDRAVDHLERRHRVHLVPA